jgi:outer membrane protein assembly factor BamB
VSEDLNATDAFPGELVKRVRPLLRPYGGVACLSLTERQHAAIADQMASADGAGFSVERKGDLSVLRRKAAPRGAADWTHEDADAANSLVSQDRRVKAPLGLLWFGGELDMLFPLWDLTHSRPPTPLVAGGRMFFQVFPRLHAADIYTGRHLWTKQLPGTDTDTRRRNIGYVAMEDSVYVVVGNTCYRIDPASGSLVGRIRCPGGKTAAWRQVRIMGDCLIGTTQRLVVCSDRIDGNIHWTRDLTGNDSRLAVSRTKVICADITLPDRRGNVLDRSCELVALDIKDGSSVWRVKRELKGQPKRPLRLSYCQDSDVVVTAFSTISAHDGRDGTLLWGERVFEGGEQPMLRKGQLITQAGELIDLRNGSVLASGLFPGKRRGCTRVIGGQHVLSIRNGQASYLNMTGGEHTYFRGIRTGCTNNLIQAGGLLNAPNFAHGCACNYPIFSSMALVNFAEIDQ